MIKFKKIAACLISAAMLASITACDEASGGNADNGSAGGNNVSDSAGTPGQTTGTTPPKVTFDTDAAVQEAAKNAAGGLDNPDLEVTKRIKWMAWWYMDETEPNAELFKEVYGIPATGDDPESAGQIFENNYISYDGRYESLATAIQAGDSPDIFPFEIRDFPYGVFRGRYQPVDKIINLDGEKWDAAREIMEQFKLNGRYYCAIYDIEFDALLYYRRSVIDGLGLGDPRELFDTGEWTWDIFLEMGRKFKQTGEGKYTIDGYNPENEFLASTGVPLISNIDGRMVSNLHAGEVERCAAFLETLQKEDLRYPRHTINNWNINLRAWTDGNTLFWGDGGTWEWTDTGANGIATWAEKYGWDEDEVVCVAFPRDPEADQYYHCMKQNALMFVKGSENPNGVAAWIDCCITTALDPEVQAASRKQQKDKYHWSDYNLDFIAQQIALDGSSDIVPIFDFKNGIGEDLCSATTLSPVEEFTKTPYLDGAKSFTQIREEYEGAINARLDEMNNEIAKIS